MSLSSTVYTKDVTIIIPVFNRRELTERCLESIARSSNRASYEVVVVNNGSTDGTDELLSCVDGDLMVINNKVNEGFAAACNRGAREAKGEYLLFLNNDTEVDDNYLDSLLETARRTPNAGAIGAKLIYPTGKVQHAGIAFNEEGTPYHIFQGFPEDHDAVCKSRAMLAVTGACLMISRRHFESVFGFDANYRNGFEDIDLCLKLAQKGLQNIYCAECTVIHLEESSEGRKQHDGENMLLFASRWSDIAVQDDFKYLTPVGLTIRWHKSGGVYEKIAHEEMQALNDNNKIQDLLDLAQKKYVEGKHEEAANVLNKIVSSSLKLGHDDEFETWQLLGNCMARLNRAEEAERAYLNAAESDGTSERPFLGLGSVAMLQENWTAAQYGFLAALSRNPQTMRAEFGLGISLAARNRHDEAIKHFKKVLSNEPHNSEAAYYLYRSSMVMGAPQQAITALAQYLEANPTDTDFWFHLAGALWKAGSFDEAIETCRRVLDMNPEYPGAESTLRFMEQHVAEAV